MSKLHSVLREGEMRKTLLAGLLALGLGLAATAAQAITIGFSPSTQTRFFGQTASVDVVVSGLSAEGQVVSGYDLDVLYNSSILGSPSIAWGSGLGGPVDSFFDVFFSVELGNVGRIDFFETSLLSDSQLGALQGDSLVLATLSFTGIGLGTSQLIFDAQAAPGVLLTGRALPNSNPPEASVLSVNPANGSITIMANTNVPEPGSLALAALGLAGLACLRRRRK